MKTRVIQKEPDEPTTPGNESRTEARTHSGLNRSSPSQLRGWPRTLLTAGVPLLFAAILLLHPDPGSNPPLTLEGHFGPWYFVHFGTLFLTPLLAAAAWTLLDGLHGRLVHVARWSLFPFMVFYVSWEALTGIGSAWLAEAALALPPDAREAMTPLLADWWGSLSSMHWMAGIGLAAWLVFIAGAAVVHWRANSPNIVVIALAFAALYPIAHGNLLGAFALFSMAVAGWRLFRPGAKRTERRALAG